MHRGRMHGARRLSQSVLWSCPNSRVPQLGPQAVTGARARRPVSSISRSGDRKKSGRFGDSAAYSMAMSASRAAQLSWSLCSPRRALCPCRPLPAHLSILLRRARAPDHLHDHPFCRFAPAAENRFLKAARLRRAVALDLRLSLSRHVSCAPPSVFSPATNVSCDL